MLAPLTLLLLLPPVLGWVSTSQEQRDSSATSLAQLRASRGNLNRVWTYPPDATSSAGLGGGLTFAYDRKICDELLPAMSEASGLWGLRFVDCDTIFAAIRSAFASWSVNHPDIRACAPARVSAALLLLVCARSRLGGSPSPRVRPLVSRRLSCFLPPASYLLPTTEFHDVTSDCLALNDASGGPFGRGCSFAEIFLTTTANSSAQDAAATTINQFVRAGTPPMEPPHGAPPMEPPNGAPAPLPLGPGALCAPPLSAMPFAHARVLHTLAAIARIDDKRPPPPPPPPVRSTAHAHIQRVHVI